MHKGRLQVSKGKNVNKVERANSAQGLLSRGIDDMNATSSLCWSSIKKMLTVIKTFLVMTLETPKNKDKTSTHMSHQATKARSHY